MRHPFDESRQVHGVALLPFVSFGHIAEPAARRPPPPQFVLSAPRPLTGMLAVWYHARVRFIYQFFGSSKKWIYQELLNNMELLYNHKDRLNKK